MLLYCSRDYLVQGVHMHALVYDMFIIPERHVQAAVINHWETKAMKAWAAQDNNTHSIDLMPGIGSCLTSDGFLIIV